MVELVEGQTVVCDLTRRTHGRRVGWCYIDGQDIAEALGGRCWAHSPVRRWSPFSPPIVAEAMMAQDGYQSVKGETAPGPRSAPPTVRLGSVTDGDSP